MTDSEVANEIVSTAAIVAANINGPAVTMVDTDVLRRDIVIAIASARLDAIAAEREACAKIAEADTSFMMLQEFGMQSTVTQVRTNIADAIRARGTES